MNIREAIITINRMQEDRVIGRYALGGAVAANFYLEPVDTADLDVFVGLEPMAGQILISLLPIYNYLESLGHSATDKGDVVISGWPVQFLPVGGDRLLQEALERSVEKDIDGTPLRVFTAEHLMAIALRLGRPKDKARLLQFLESSGSSTTRPTFDEAALNLILERYLLTDRWVEFRKKLTE